MKYLSLQKASGLRIERRRSGVCVMRRWGSVVVICVAVAIGAACTTTSGSIGRNGDSSTRQPASSVAVRSPAGNATPTTTQRGEAFPPSGILVSERQINGEYRIGAINPDTGEYRDVRKFKSPSGITVATLGNKFWTSDIREQAEKMWSLSPDGNKLAAAMNVNNQAHAGWIGVEGKFTDVTADQSQGAFDGIVDFEPIGFDTAGRYYYLKNLATAHRLDAYIVDSTGQNPRLLGSLAPTAVLHRLTVNRDSGAVTYQDSPDCDYYSRIGNGILTTGQFQIYYASSGSCRDTGLPVLPAANTNPISQPVGNAQLNAIAFKLQNDHGPVVGSIDLYTVPLNGGAQPKLVKVTGIKISDYDLIAWN
jgi:hypothetical protein